MTIERAIDWADKIAFENIMIGTFFSRENDDDIYLRIADNDDSGINALNLSINDWIWIDDDELVTERKGYFKIMMLCEPFNVLYQRLNELSPVTGFVYRDTPYIMITKGNLCRDEETFEVFNLIDCKIEYFEDIKVVVHQFTLCIED